MLEDQLILRAGFQEQREFVEALDAPQQLRAVDEINRDGSFLAAREIQKTILDVLWYYFRIQETIAPIAKWQNGRSEYNSESNLTSVFSCKASPNR